MTQHTSSSRRLPCQGMAAGFIALAVMGWAFAAECRADERVERFLPENTFMYGGVERLGPTVDKVIALFQRAMPGAREQLSVDQIARELSRGIGLRQVRTRDEFVAQTGLDLEGSAGIAWVLADPSYPFWRQPNENVLVILPVKDPARAQLVMAERLLSQFRRESKMLCVRTISRLRRAKENWKRANRDRPAAPLTWETLAAANPRLKKLRCPGGGEYTLGGPDEPVTCSAHGAHPRRMPEAHVPRSREELGVRRIGEVTLFGGRKVGTGYALTDTHIILSNNMNVLEDAVNAATGAAPRAALAALSRSPAHADMRGFFQAGLLLRLAVNELQGSRRYQRRAPFAVRRLVKLLRSAGSLTAEARIGPAVSLAVVANIQRNEATRALLDTAPGKLDALGLVPDTALLAVGTNLSRVTLSVLGDICLLEEPRVAAATKLTMAAAGGDGAFAFTRGGFEGEVPNMLIILRIRDRELMQDAAELWTSIIAREIRAEGVERSEVGGVTVWSLKYKRNQGLHYAYVGPFLVGGTNLDDVKAAIELHAGRAQNALVACDRFRKLELSAGAANVIAYVDMPSLVGQISAGEHERRARWRNERCLRNMRHIEQLIQKHKRKTGRLPATFGELTPPQADRSRRRTVRGWCMMFGQQTKLNLDQNTGKVSCPKHGTVADFKPIPFLRSRRRSQEEQLFSAFGVGAVRLFIEGGQLKGEGRLIPAAP